MNSIAKLKIRWHIMANRQEKDNWKSHLPINVTCRSVVLHRLSGGYVCASLNFFKSTQHMVFRNSSPVLTHTGYTDQWPWLLVSHQSDSNRSP